MSGVEHTRRLVAILAADAAGYSRLMATDEGGTVASLDAARAVFRKQIESNRGRVIDTAGDSVLAVFNTATGAVIAAIAIQDVLATASLSEPEDKRMRFRIGVHLGDVIEKADGTVYGDGVNVAARLQGMAEPGGITVSDSVRNAVRSKVTATFDDRGEQSVKNIAEPVRAYVVRSGSEGTPRFAAPKMGLPPDRHSIAVLPFTNMSANKGNAYFADGIQEELLTQLALLGELKVVSRTSVMEYRESKKNIRQIAAELGVRSLVEGSVRRAGNRVRVTAQLIDASSDTHTWGGSFDRELRDVFAIQSELATEIARALKVSLTPRDEAQLMRKPTENFEAYELYLRFQEVRKANNPTTHSELMMCFDEQLSLLSRAVELDSGFALAWARLGRLEAVVCWHSGDPTGDRLTRAQLAIDRALGLAPDDMEVRLQLGYIYWLGYGDLARATQYMEDLLRLAPNHVEMLVHLAQMRIPQGRWADSNLLLNRALAVDWRNLDAVEVLRNTAYRFRHFDESVDLQKRIMELDPGSLRNTAYLYWMEHRKSASFARYDAWRKNLTAVEARSYWVWQIDVFRALERRDLDAALRFLESPPSEGASPFQYSIHSFRPCLLLALGRSTEALELARLKLPEAREESSRAPGSFILQIDVLRCLAILGDRDAVFLEFQQLRESFRYHWNAEMAAEPIALKASALGLLGDREQALEAFARYAKEPTRWVGWEYANVDPAYASLWDEPRFIAIMNDPTNSTPFPIQNLGMPQMSE